MASGNSDRSIPTQKVLMPIKVRRSDGSVDTEQDYFYLASDVDDRIAELLEERDELAKDAERYRWLRDPCSGAERVIFYCRGDYGRGLKSGSWLDAAIDDAMGKEASNG